MKKLILSTAICLFAISGATTADEQSARIGKAEFVEILTSAASSDSSPFEFNGRQVTAANCCKYCKKGKPCGDTCIAQDKVCHVGPGCAC
jgi:hypothetical protein